MDTVYSAIFPVCCNCWFSLCSNPATELLGFLCFRWLLRLVSTGAGFELKSLALGPWFCILLHIGLSKWVARSLFQWEPRMHIGKSSKIRLGKDGAVEEWKI